MKQINSVFKLNIKSRGYSFVWLKPEPILENISVDEFLPKSPDNLYGASLAFRSKRISQNRFFWAITGNWNVSDEFGRQGLSFWQGNIVEVDKEDNDSIFASLELILNVLRSYQLGYETIGHLLEDIATQEQTEESAEYKVKAIGSKILEASKIKINQSTAQDIKLIAEKLLQYKDKILLYPDFPWQEDFALCCLLYLQFTSDSINDVGAGKLQSYQKFNCISTNKDVGGFQTIYLGKISSEIREKKKEPTPTPKVLPVLLSNSVKIFTVILLAILFIYLSSSFFLRFHNFETINKGKVLITQDNRNDDSSISIQGSTTRNGKYTMVSIRRIPIPNSKEDKIIKLSQNSQIRGTIYLDDGNANIKEYQLNPETTDIAIEFKNNTLKKKWLKVKFMA
jgi:hypothetical protein